MLRLSAGSLFMGRIVEYATNYSKHLFQFNSCYESITCRLMSAQLNSFL